MTKVICEKAQDGDCCGETDFIGACHWATPSTGRQRIIYCGDDEVELVPVSGEEKTNAGK